jgi:broad specificity phosphatase PhoE
MAKWQTIFLVRHGETQWNAEGRIQGRIQHVMLNEVGIRQSQLLAKRLERERIDVVYSSPLERALQTAEIIAELHGASIITHAGITERNHGTLEGMTKEEFKMKHPKVFLTYQKTKEMPGIKGAESLKDLKERGFATFMEIVSENPGKNILVVSHGGILRGIISAVSGMKSTEIRQPNCCLNIIKHDGKNYRVAAVNDVSHLEMAAD